MTDSIFMNIFIFLVYFSQLFKKKKPFLTNENSNVKIKKQGH